MEAWNDYLFVNTNKPQTIRFDSCFQKNRRDFDFCPVSDVPSALASEFGKCPLDAFISLGEATYLKVETGEGNQSVSVIRKSQQSQVQQSLNKKKIQFRI